MVKMVYACGGDGWLCWEGEVYLPCKWCKWGTRVVVMVCYAGKERCTLSVNGENGVNGVRVWW